MVTSDKFLYGGYYDKPGQAIDYLRKITNVVTDCPKQLSSLRSYLPEQMKLLDGCSEIYLYEILTSDCVVLHGGLFAEYYTRLNSMKIFEDWMLELDDVLDNSFEIKKNFDVFLQKLPVLSRAHVELMKPVIVDRPDLLSLLRNVIKYERQMIILHRDRIENYQAEFSFGTPRC
jgi:hypothetical protein